MGDHFGGAVTQLGQRIGLKPHLFQTVDRGHLGVGQRFRNFAPGVGKEPKRARAGDRRIQLAQRSGRRVARVGKGFAAALGLAGVQRRKVGVAHVNLAAHFQNGRGVFDALGNVVDGQRIGGHVFAHLTVAACRRRDQRAVFIAQRQRQPVDLGFRRVCQRGIGGQPKVFAHPPVEIRDILSLERVGQ